MGGAMDWPITLALTAAALAVAVFAGWRGAQPYDIARGPRMFPWRWIMVFAAAVVLFLIVHMLNLAGANTGR